MPLFDNQTLNILIALIIGIVGSLVSIFIYNVIKALRIRGIRKKSLTKYKRKLEQRIKKMPFIYGAVHIEVLQGYVDVDIKGILSETLQPLPDSYVNLNDIYSDFRFNRRIIILGSAGTGKTTLQRYEAMLLLQSVSENPFVGESETRTIPIYVPLKILHNTKTFPIVEYILSNISLFGESKRGASRLIKYAKQGRVFLFLDGFDEIMVGKDSRNFIAEELKYLLIPEVLNNHVASIFNSKMIKNKIDYYDIYLALSNIRIWLSSRKVFLKEHFIKKVELNKLKKSKELKIFELTGIGNNRYLLAEKIIKRHYINDPENIEYLNGEYLISSIDNSLDNDIIEMSYNPLFLTVMCYVYAKRALKEKNKNADWITYDSRILIQDCINLLLRDLDAEKARDLPGSTQAAIRTRRNLYYDEKYEFLRYFASSLNAENKTVFTYNYLKKKAKSYLLTESKSSKKEIILKEFKNNGRKVQFVSDLIDCGIFVLIGESDKIELFDFPHRRFREFLSSLEYLYPKKYIEYLIQAQGTNISEQLDYNKTLEQFRKEEFQIHSLNILLDFASNGDKSNKLRLPSSILLNVLRDLDNIDHTSTFENFLLNVFHSNKPEFELSKDFFSNFIPSFEFVTNVNHHMSLSMERSNLHQVALTTQILCNIDFNSFKRGLEELILKYCKDFSTITTILNQLIEYDKDDFFNYLKQNCDSILSQETVRDIIIAFIINYANKDYNYAIKVIKLFNNISEEIHLKFSVMCYIYSTKYLSAFCKEFDVRNSVAVMQFVENNKKAKKPRIKIPLNNDLIDKTNDQMNNIYFVNDIELIIDKTINSIFATEPFIINLAKKGKGINDKQHLVSFSKKELIEIINVTVMKSNTYTNKFINDSSLFVYFICDIFKKREVISHLKTEANPSISKDKIIDSKVVEQTIFQAMIKETIFTKDHYDLLKKYYTEQKKKHFYNDIPLYFS